MKKFTHEPEGATSLEPEELEGLLHPHIQTRGQLNELEQINIQEGMAWLKRQKKAGILSEEFSCELHKKLFGKVWNWAGQFRRTGKSIGCDAIYISVELRNLLDDARYWVDHNTYPSKELAARFHHRLVAIHLFPNGNGRHARIMADAILTHILKENPIDWSGGYDLQAMSERRKQYITALRSADRGDYQPLLESLEFVT